jgi:hypothetical protein
VLGRLEGRGPKFPTAILALAALLVGCFGLRASERSIERDLLDLVPLSTGRSSAKGILEAQGYTRQAADSARAEACALKNWNYAERYWLGEYRTVFATDVVATFCFDENDRLVSVHVRKLVDSL